MRASAPKFAPPGSLLDWDWVLELLAAARSAWLATVRPDGRPHASPLWVVVVDRRIWFSTSATTTKARNLAHDKRVVLHVEAGDHVAIVEGSAVRRRGEGVAAAYAAKYGWAGPDPETLWEVAVDSALAWRGHLGSAQIDATRFSRVG
jgi:PPOX class probable F420-dependent enzyme